MFRLEKSCWINAPIDRCFLLSTSIALVERTIGLKPVEGKVSGLVMGGDRLVWRGWKFGIPAMHETLITGYERPNFFQDTMGAGRFRFFQHDHHFSEMGGQTYLRDVVKFSLPLWGAGRMVGKLVVAPHVLKLMRQRFQLLRDIAESNDWRHYVADGSPDPAERASDTLR
jgi:ligand-binding SRPBCC domain-containing protein